MLKQLRLLKPGMRGCFTRFALTGAFARLFSCPELAYFLAEPPPAPLPAALPESEASSALPPLPPLPPPLPAPPHSSHPPVTTDARPRSQERRPRERRPAPPVPWDPAQEGCRPTRRELDRVAAALTRTAPAGVAPSPHRGAPIKHLTPEEYLAAREAETAWPLPALSPAPEATPAPKKTHSPQTPTPDGDELLSRLGEALAARGISSLVLPVRIEVSRFSWGGLCLRLVYASVAAFRATEAIEIPGGARPIFEELCGEEVDAVGTWEGPGDELDHEAAEEGAREAELYDQELEDEEDDCPFWPRGEEAPAPPRPSPKPARPRPVSPPSFSVFLRRALEGLMALTGAKVIRADSVAYLDAHEDAKEQHRAALLAYQLACQEYDAQAYPQATTPGGESAEG